MNPFVGVSAGIVSVAVSGDDAVVTGARVAAVRGREEWSTPAERHRRRLLRRPDDRAAHLAARTLVREAVADLTGAVAGDVAIANLCPGCGSTDHGRPHVVGDPRVHVSLAHSRSHVAAVAAWHPCGIDVEDVDARAVPERAFTDAERSWLAAPTNAAGQVRRDLVLWTRKEALVKAGAGSMGDLAGLECAAAAGLLATVHGLTLRTFPA